jgi:multisubunit Na+/H+ antiporter MnhB subunit
MDGNDHVDDPRASALLGDSTYERIRMQRYSLFQQSIPKKLGWQSLILGALALVVPMAMMQPETTRALLGGDPLSAAPKFLFLGMYASAIEFVATLGLCYVAYRRITAEDALDERQVRDLLAIEDVASNVSLVTGGAAVAAVHGFFLLGLGGEPIVEEVVSLAGRNPFTDGFIPATVTLVAASATVLAVFSFALSRVLADRLPN